MLFFKSTIVVVDIHSKKVGVCITFDSHFLGNITQKMVRAILSSSWLYWKYYTIIVKPSKKVGVCITLDSRNIAQKMIRAILISSWLYWKYYTIVVKPFDHDQFCVSASWYIQ